MSVKVYSRSAIVKQIPHILFSASLTVEAKISPSFKQEYYKNFHITATSMIDTGLKTEYVFGDEIVIERSEEGFFAPFSVYRLVVDENDKESLVEIENDVEKALALSNFFHVVVADLNSEWLNDTNQTVKEIQYQFLTEENTSAIMKIADKITAKYHEQKKAESLNKADEMLLKISNALGIDPSKIKIIGLDEKEISNVEAMNILRDLANVTKK